MAEIRSSCILSSLLFFLFPPSFLSFFPSFFLFSLSLSLSLPSFLSRARTPCNHGNGTQEEKLDYLPTRPRSSLYPPRHLASPQAICNINGLAGPPKAHLSLCTSICICGIPGAPLLLTGNIPLPGEQAARSRWACIFPKPVGCNQGAQRH